MHLRNACLGFKGRHPSGDNVARPTPCNPILRADWLQTLGAFLWLLPLRNNTYTAMTTICLLNLISKASGLAEGVVKQSEKRVSR